MGEINRVIGRVLGVAEWRITDDIRALKAHATAIVDPLQKARGDVVVGDEVDVPLAEFRNIGAFKQLPTDPLGTGIVVVVVPTIPSARNVGCAPPEVELARRAFHSGRDKIHELLQVLTTDIGPNGLRLGRVERETPMPDRLGVELDFPALRDTVFGNCESSRHVNCTTTGHRINRLARLNIRQALVAPRGPEARIDRILECTIAGNRGSFFTLSSCRYVTVDIDVVIPRPYIVVGSVIPNLIVGRRLRPFPIADVVLEDVRINGTVSEKIANVISELIRTGGSGVLDARHVAIDLQRIPAVACLDLDAPVDRFARWRRD